jgi:nucleolar protein 56
VLKAIIIHSPLGIFAFDAEDRVIAGTLFPKDPDDVAEILEKLGRGESVLEVDKLRTELDEKGCNELISEDLALASAFKRENSSIKVDTAIGKGGLLRERIEETALEKGQFESREEMRTFLHDVSVAIARRVVQEESGRRDLMVMQAVLALDDVDHTFNLFANRLREWYGYHFPEMGSIIDESDLYVRLVASLDGRTNLTVENLTKEGLSPEKAESLAKASENSMGAELSEEDLKEIVEFAQFLLKFHESKTRLEEYLEIVMKEVAPNTSILLGPTLGARLIATAGGLQNLAKRSASTIQILGAEKALFRSLRTGSRPPKHGLIFQHKDIHQAPRWQRGKIARALAGKVAIAIRLDAYNGDYLGEKLLEDFVKRVDEIREKYAQPPSRGAKNGRS